ncbi:MAG TPA: hypothetical protein VFV98_20040 [Vicinamibacterales bacterium]|nr:hypothetical protein [Vicinamibacterales bacterium]
MDIKAIAAVGAFVAFLVGAQIAMYRISRGRLWSAQWAAFSFTTGAALFLVAGFVGYNLSRHARFLSGTGWTGGVIWSEVLVGAVMAAIAAFCWIRALSVAR